MMENTVSVVAMSETYREASKELDRRMERFAGFTLDGGDTDEYLVYDRENGEAWVQSNEFYQLDEMC